VSDPFISEIQIMSFGFAPRGWAACNGQLLPIAQYQALYSLLGTNYGGDGRNTFGLPNLQARIPMHAGNGHGLAEAGGEPVHTLTTSEVPLHAHTANGVAVAGNTPIAAGNFLAQADNTYAGLADATALSPATIGSTGGSLPHENSQPYLVLNFCIALSGVFPSQN
jgi:microcystin-dependent protein